MGRIKRFWVIGTLLVLVAGVSATCIMRKARLTGTYIGQWESGLDDTMHVESDGPKQLAIECTNCVIDEEFDARITENKAFRVDDENINLVRRGQNLIVDIEGRGTYDFRQLDLEIRMTGQNGTAESFRFVGEKE